MRIGFPDEPSERRPAIHRHGRRHRPRRGQRVAPGPRAPRGSSPGWRPRPAPPSHRPCPRAAPASAPGSTSSTSAPVPWARSWRSARHPSYVDGRLHRFTVAARHLDAGVLGAVVGTGEVTRRRGRRGAVPAASPALRLARGVREAREGRAGKQWTPGRWPGVQMLDACAQALGRLPWFAPFFLRARRLRPVLPMVSSWMSVAAILSNDARPKPISPGASRSLGRAALTAPRCRPAPGGSAGAPAGAAPSGAASLHDRATIDFTVRCRS